MLLDVQLLASVSLGQSSQQPDEMLEIKGVELRLGMDERVVAQKLREKNFGVREADSSEPGRKTWFLCESPDVKDCDPVLGQVSFYNRRLNVISKQWVDTKSATEVVSAFYGATKDLKKRGFTHCQLATEETLEPGSEIQYVEMKCSAHLSLRIIRFHSTKTPSPVPVQEVLFTKWAGNALAISLALLDRMVWPSSEPWPGRLPPALPLPLSPYCNGSSLYLRHCAHSRRPAPPLLPRPG
jgi:hypothetical protein